jgi:hypothetical protein
MFDRTRTRRELFADVGRGMFLSGLGTALAGDLGLCPAWAAEEPGSLTFGDLDPLVAFVRDTPADKLLPLAVEKLRSGTDLKQLVAAAALANARAFGGEDYVGFHTLMALPPAFHMAAEERDPARRPLPVLKVLVRNATRLQEFGPTKETLKPVKPGTPDKSRPGGEQLRDAVRARDLAAAEQAFAAVGGAPEDALNNLLVMVDDATEVHRVVLVARAWELLDYVGRDKAHTLLRQSVHYCVKNEQGTAKSQGEVRTLLPKLLDQHKLMGRTAGTRSADDAWVVKFADTVFAGTGAQAAEATAAALAEGFDPVAIGEAISLAANQLVLRDEGRPKEWAQPNKPIGSVHGDSIGVHGCDTINAWRNLARAGDRRTQVTSLILAAYEVGRDRSGRGDLFLKSDPYPRSEHAEKVKGIAADKLLGELGGAVRDKDQGRAAAVAARLGEAKADPAAVFAVLRDFAVSEDGALHAEKFYRTTTEEFASARPAFRWRQLVALARVTASAYGYPAPGFKDACGLLKKG